jgi:hypothetical protein
VPSDVPQPKLKLAVPLPAGLPCSVMAAPVAVAPMVQALTVQRTCLPRSLLACAAVTSTQRLACVVPGLVVGDAVAVVAGSVDVDGSGAAGVDVDGSGAVGVDVDGLGAVGVSVGVGEVAVAVCVVPVVAGRDGDVDVLCDGVRSGVGVGVVLVGLVVVDGDVVVGVGEGLGDAAGSRSGSHDCLPAGATALVAGRVAAVVAAAAKLTPETAVNRTLPATRATAAGRGCANRMKTPTDAARYCSERLTRTRQSLPVRLGSSQRAAESQT